ncbi:hypothetical protein AB6A40_006141 [Gnathostoma spinigerum]|uniref:DUF1279 domain-containing protein n=1 Tax=Gnathostoma spinigerum TaxID=75299 RepID=A0ABD6ESA0_9BILA
MFLSFALRPFSFTSVVAMCATAATIRRLCFKQFQPLSFFSSRIRLHFVKFGSFSQCGKYSLSRKVQECVSVQRTNLSLISRTQDLSIAQPRRISSSSSVRGRWKISMDEDEKKKKKAEIEKMEKEKEPKGLFAKVKYYVRRYWYIAIPVHIAGSILWFTGLYAAVRSGIDVMAFLECIRTPEFLLEKARNTPASAGAIVITFVLFKVVSPLRYMTTIAGIQMAFSTLRRMGKLKTVKEVEYKVRAGYESEMARLRRRYNKHRKLTDHEAKRRSSSEK